MSDEQALVQASVTGCLNSTYYVKAEDHLDSVLALANKVSSEFLAKVSLYARERGHMKDMPAFLTAVLAHRDVELMTKIFPRVINDHKMVRNFIQIIRSGKVGRKSLGYRPKKLIQNWLMNLKGRNLLNATVGNDPAFSDIVKMVHPKPADDAMRSYFAWAIGKEHNVEHLPEDVRKFIQWTSSPTDEIPEVDFRLLTASKLSDNMWKKIAEHASWQTVRQNLNTFERHVCFSDQKLVDQIANKLKDKEQIKKAKCFPYQLMATYLNISETIPSKIKDAIHDAMEFSVTNVPSYNGKTVVCPDVSGSMSSPITGHRRGSTSKMRCIDIAALVSACILRSNHDAMVIPFEQTIVDSKKLDLEPRDTILTNAKKLSSIGGGGTNCSSPLVLLNQKNIVPDLVIYISDNESWVDSYDRYGYHRGDTSMMGEWSKIQKKNSHAKLVCIDITPNCSTQMTESQNRLLVGGFSDSVFDIINSFVSGDLDSSRLVKVIKNIKI